MLTNKQSILLCAFVAIGFCISAATGILDNYVIVAVLVLAFLAIIINIYIRKSDAQKKSENKDE